MSKNTASTPYRVLAVDDHTMFRQALVSLLETRPATFRVVGEARDSCEAVLLARDVGAELILLDVSLPDCSGIDIIESLHDAVPNAKIVMLSGSGDGQSVYDAISRGAVGYLTKNLGAQQLFDQLESAMNGYIVFTPDSVTQFTRHVLSQQGVHSTDSAATALATFDALDTEIIRLVAEGRTNVEIAQETHVSTHTVKVHLTAILAALKLENRTQLAVYAKSSTRTSGY